jgi:hypothetical protein
MRRISLAIVAAIAVLHTGPDGEGNAQEMNACPGPGFMANAMLCVTRPPRRPLRQPPKPGPSLLEVQQFLGDAELPSESTGLLTEDRFILQPQNPAITAYIRKEVSSYDPVDKIEADRLYIFVPADRINGLPTDLQGLLFPGSALIP